MLYRPNDTFGILTQYSYGGDGFQRSIGLFDVRRLARNLSKTGATRYMINLNCPDGYMLSPSLVYGEAVGSAGAEKISSRDIPLILGAELEKYGIGLYLYYSAAPSYFDSDAARAFGAAEDKVPLSLIKKHSEILEEYSRRFSTLVKGWMIDDCNPYPNPAGEVADLLYDACKSGNRDALVSFSRSAKPVSSRITIHEDCVSITRCDNFAYVPKKTVHAHIITTLGTSDDGSWGELGLRHDAEQLCSYIKRLHRAWCTLTIDCKIYPDGTFEAGQFNELCKLSDMLKNDGN